MNGFGVYFKIALSSLRKAILFTLWTFRVVFSGHRGLISSCNWKSHWPNCKPVLLWTVRYWYEWSVFCRLFWSVGVGSSFLYRLYAGNPQSGVSRLQLVQNAVTATKKTDRSVFPQFRYLFAGFPSSLELLSLTTFAFTLILERWDHSINFFYPSPAVVLRRRLIEPFPRSIPFSRGGPLHL